MEVIKGGLTLGQLDLDVVFLSPAGASKVHILKGWTILRPGLIQILHYIFSRLTYYTTLCVALLFL